MLDGVYGWDSEAVPVFASVAPPRNVEVQQLVDQLAVGVERLLRRRGLLGEEPGDEEEPEDGQLLMMAASAAGRAALGRRAGRRPRVLRGPPRSGGRLPALCARSGWFNLHAGVSVRDGDKMGLERLCRYVARPPLSLDRLDERADGLVAVRFKRGSSDGTAAIVLTGVELIERLAALVPRPRAHRVLYGGVLAPAAAWRPLVVPKPPPSERHSLGERCAHGKGSRYVPWRDLLYRVFGVDPLLCGKCGSRLRVHAVVKRFWATQRVLGCLGLSVWAPSLRAPPLWSA